MTTSASIDAAPADWVPWPHPSPLLDAIGGFLRHPHDPRRVGFVAEGPKLNARGFLHAGAIAAVADVAIGHVLADLAAPPSGAVTVNLSCDLLDTAQDGEWVEVLVVPTKMGRRLRAGSATVHVVGDPPRLVATVTALFVPV
jgi:acyl-coenzyme A thioesterase PaaI-like protein